MKQAPIEINCYYKIQQLKNKQLTNSQIVTGMTMTVSFKMFLRLRLQCLRHNDGHT